MIKKRIIDKRKKEKFMVDDEYLNEYAIFDFDDQLMIDTVSVFLFDWVKSKS